MQKNEYQLDIVLQKDWIDRLESKSYEERMVSED